MISAGNGSTIGGGLPPVVADGLTGAGVDETAVVCEPGADEAHPVSDGATVSEFKFLLSGRRRLFLVPRPIPEHSSALLYHDPRASIWIMRLELPRFREPLFLGGNDGELFLELLDHGTVFRAGVLVTGLEVVDTTDLRLEVEGDKGRLFRVEGSADTLIAGALALVRQDDLGRILKEPRFYQIGRLTRTLEQRYSDGDPDAILAYAKTAEYPDMLSRIAPDKMEALGHAARENDRALFALCIFADKYHSNASRVLGQLGNRRLEPVARRSKSAVHVLWERAKEGNREALGIMGRLAVDVEHALIMLLNLYSVWGLKGVDEILHRMPIERMETSPHQLDLFVKAGHPSAGERLAAMSPQRYVDEARKNTWARDVINCNPVYQLGVMVRYGNAQALEGLLELYAEGHLPAREMVNELMHKGVIEIGIIQRVDLTRLAEKAVTNPRIVIAIDGFRRDGHVAAETILRDLEPIDELARSASSEYEAVVALSILDRAGNFRVRPRINNVSIEKWRKEYNYRGHAKIEGREARDAMAILAGLGHEGAARHEGIEMPRRAMRTLAAAQAVAQLRKEGVEVEVVGTGSPLEPLAAPQVPADSGDGSKKPSN